MPVPLIKRALDAFATEGVDPSASSFFSRSGRFLLLSDSRSDAEPNIELFVEFPEGSENTPKNLDLNISLGVKNDVLFEGAFRTRASVDNELLTPTGKWEIVCEDFDSKRAFCEIVAPLERGRRFSRRFLFAYRESLLLVFDELDDDKSKRKDNSLLSLRETFPLTRGIDVLQDDEAREITFSREKNSENRDDAKTVFATKKSNRLSEEDAFIESLYSEEPTEKESLVNIAKVFPLDLPEWRCDKSRGELLVNKRSLKLELSGNRRGRTLVSSLLIDVCPQRAARFCTWKPLSVGEGGINVDEDAALGRKIQLGKEQFVLYASTSERPKVRSVISRNLISEFMFGKFLVKRGVDPIVDVEIES